MLHHIQLLRPINSGRYGTVYKAFDHRVRDFRAVKVLPKKRHDLNDAENTRMIENEIHNMLKVKGLSNVVELHDIMNDDDSVYLIEELCGGNTLQEYILHKSMSPRAIARTLHNITTAVAGCHAKGIMVCDVKPSNMVYSIEEAAYKLTDFGASIDKTINSHQMITSATYAYASPELISERHASFPHDVWSIGIIAYQLIHGSLPTRDSIPIIANLHDPAHNFISAALAIDPAERMTAEELLAHPYLTVAGARYTSVR